jgi:hypothetical protein
MRFPKLHNAKELAALVQRIGFLPFFANEIPGFSVEECTPAGYWFVDGVEGPWDWKSEIAEKKLSLYGKLFRGRAGYVSPEWLPVFANYRRDGYDFDARYDDGMASFKDKQIMDYLEKHGASLSTELREALNYGKGGNRGFETVLTRLQMETYVAVKDFEYRKDSRGQEYGWGVARYAVSEAWLGKRLLRSGYRESPEDSFLRMVDHLCRMLPQAEEEEIIRLLK